MTFLASLSKLKSLFPVIVVGASVAITIKLLTESSPTTSNIFQVFATEDILETSYEDKLEVPPEPESEKPPATEETPPQSDPEDEENKESEKRDDTKNEDGEDKSKETTDKKEPEQKEQQKSAAKRKLIPDGIGGLLGRILNPQKQN